MLYLYIYLILLIIVYYYYTNSITIIFLNNYQLAHYLIQDKDNYYSSLSLENLQLRNIEDKGIFLANIHNYLYTLTNREKIIVQNAIYKAHNLLKNININGFNYSKLKNYKWIIGCSYGTKYEFGYPHTRNNIIILNYDNIYEENLYKTLIHERIHIYQKLFPNDIQQYLQFNNFKKYIKQDSYHLANPDTDNYIYTLNNQIYECRIYNNSLEYTNNNFHYEHPYEFMAYTITQEIS
jgi:hypothetical protein